MGLPVVYPTPRRQLTLCLYKRGRQRNRKKKKEARRREKILKERKKIEDVTKVASSKKGGDFTHEKMKRLK